MTKGAFQSQLSYSLKTEYPTYNQLRAGLSYSSPYLYESGNPDLCPETRHELSFLGKFLNSSLMLNYTAIRDEIIQVPTLYSDNIMLYRPENTGTNKISFIVGWAANKLGRYYRKFIKSELSFSMVECCRFYKKER